MPRFAASPPRRSTLFLLAFALANVGGVIGYLPLLTLLLPLKIEAIAGAGRIGIFTATVVAGAIAASLANILFGWLSDRSVARGRGRRSGMVAGLGATIVAYAMVAAAQAPITIVAAIVAFQIAVNAVLAPLFALMADEIPDAQKGIAGGLLALANPAASGLSAVLIGLPMVGEGARLAIIVAVMTLCTLPLLLVRAAGAAPANAPAPAAPAALAAVTTDAAPAPANANAALSRRDLLVVGAARLLMQVTSAVSLAYLLYYFESIVDDQRDLPARVGTLMAVGFVLSLPVAVVLGRLSDGVARRKPFLVGAALVAAAGLAGMAVATSWASGAAAFCVYAIGSAVFAALHSAFAMQLLPQPSRRGRDLGLLNLTNTLPSLLGPPLTWMLATPHDFTPVMLLLAGFSLCSGACILLVGGRR